MDMKRMLIVGLACVMALLTACGKGEEPHDHTHETAASATATVAAGPTEHTHASATNDVIRFNKPKDHAHVNAKLVTPTTVDKAAFTAAYDIRWQGMFDDTSYQTAYTLYHYTEATAEEMGLSGLCYGQVHVTKDGESAMVMYVSVSGYVGDVSYPDADTLPSKIGGQQVYLVDASASRTPSMYATFRWGKHYVTCKLYDCEQNDLVNFVRSVLTNTPR